MRTLAQVAFFMSSLMTIADDSRSNQNLNSLLTNIVQLIAAATVFALDFNMQIRIFFESKLRCKL